MLQPPPPPQQPDNVFGLVADVLQVHVESEPIQRQVPQPAEFAHFIRKRAQPLVPAHIQRCQVLQQAYLTWNLKRSIQNTIKILAQ